MLTGRCKAASRAEAKDTSAKQAYKCLDSLRKGFDRLVQLVEEMVGAAVLFLFLPA